MLILLDLLKNPIFSRGSQETNGILVGYVALYYFSIIPDHYDGSAPIFISDRPSVSIGTYFFAWFS